MFVTPLLRRLARLPGLRRLRRHERVARVADALYYARLVEEQTRFFVGELLRRPAVGRYRPRNARLDVFVRHQTSDRYILDEIFGVGLYELPAGAKTSLAGVARPRALDLGAHIGLFGAFFLSRFPRGELDAFEPDPGNAELLERCVAASGLAARWRVIRAAAAAADGRALLLAGRYAESQVTLGASGAIDVDARDVFPFLATAHLVKIDVEGSEWAILGDPRFERIDARVVALEYHPQGCPEPDPRTAAITLFDRLGYVVEEVDIAHAPAGVGMLWAWRATSGSPV